MSNNINSLSPQLQEIVRREVERQVKQALQEKKQLQPIDDPQMVRSLSIAPRALPLSVRLYLRLSSTTASFLGWFFAGFGFMFALVAVGLMGLDDAIPRRWSDTGKATITNIEQTRSSMNDVKIFAYHFEAEAITGISYGFKGKHKTGDEVPLQKAGKRYRIQGLGLTPIGGADWWFPLVFFGGGMLFGVIGLCFPIYSWFAGGKAIHLLHDGTATGARYVGMNPTGTQINRIELMKVDFEYQVDGTMYTASAHALDTSRLNDGKNKVVLYDPMLPSESIVLEGLPKGLYFDEMSGQFQTGVMRCVIPLLAAAIVGAQLVTIVVLAIKAI